MNLNKPAIEGGSPVRDTPLPYATQWLGDEEWCAIEDVLRSGWLTTGPKTEEFEAALSAYAGAPHAVAVTSCTAALQLALNALGIGPGGEVITTSLTFAATVFSILYNGAAPVLADIDPDTLNIDPADIERRITPRTRAILPMHYGGDPCDMAAIVDIAKRNNLAVVSDAAHAIGARYAGEPVARFGNAACFSFHAVKNMTTIEGGAILCADADLAGKLRARRFFGIANDAWQRAASDKPWEYDVSSIGFKCNITDFQSAMGIVQLKKLDSFLKRRREIVNKYNEAFSKIDGVLLKKDTPGGVSANHLYVIRIEPERFRVDRDRILAALRAEGIIANIHYKPIHLHTYFMKQLGTKRGMLPHCEAAADALITLPLFPAMTDADAESVVSALQKILDFYKR